MKLILDLDYKKIYYTHFKGGNLIIIQSYNGTERVYNMSEALRRGIVYYEKGKRFVLTHNGYDIVCREF